MQSAGPDAQEVRVGSGSRGGDGRGRRDGRVYVLCGTWESSRFSRLSSGLRRVRDVWELRETRDCAHRPYDSDYSL